jgi:hypothetical protein
VKLIASFSGWCLLRLATDPDPTDEPRGVSGYTFAFAGEPDLDRVLRLQPPADFTPRSQSPALGVAVTEAVRSDTGAAIPALVGAAVDLADDPVLENRNWTLTLPGYEPIVPFHLRIATTALQISRDAPLNPADPDQPVWQAPASVIAAHGAAGMAYEPETIGRATGIWDSLALVTKRLGLLQAELAQETDPVKATALQGRIAELEFALANPNDRRVMARYFVERFGFPVLGPATVTGDQQSLLGGQLDTTAPWLAAFWLGAWDPDLLCTYMQGTIEIPYSTTPGADA